MSLVPAVAGSAALPGVAECVLKELSSPVLPMPSEDRKSLEGLSSVINLSLFVSSFYFDLNLNVCPVAPGILRIAIIVGINK